MVLWFYGDTVLLVGIGQTRANVTVNIALNPTRSGNPNPLESDAGWGGGTDVWDIVDGNKQ